MKVNWYNVRGWARNVDWSKVSQTIQEQLMELLELKKHCGAEDDDPDNPDCPFESEDYFDEVLKDIVKNRL